MAITITEPSATLPNGTISRFVPVHNPILFTITSGSTSIKIDIHRTDASPSIINTNDLIFLAGTDFTFVFDASPYVKSIMNNDLDITYTADATKEDTEGVLPFYIVVTEYPEASPIVSETSNTFYGVNSVLQVQNRYGNNQGNYLVDDNADVANLVDFLIGSDRLRYWIGYPFSLPYLNNDVTTTAINIDGELVFTTSIADSVNHYILSLQTEGARNIYLQSVFGFTSVWNSVTTSTGSSNADQIALPLIVSGTYNFIVDWGDGTQDIITTYNQAEVTHTYTSSGTKGITIVGTIQGWQFNNLGDKEKILSISNWGSLDISNTNAFYGCSNLTLTSVEGTPTLSGNTLSGFFRSCTSLTTVNNIDTWTLSIVTNFSSTFQGATSFNQDLSTCNVSSATTFASMFNGASAFNNGGVALTWTMGTSCLSTSEMFNNADAFTVAINNTGAGSWSAAMGSVTNPSYMFVNTLLFNQNLSNWDISSATTIEAIFQSASAFNNGGVALTWTMGTSITTCFRAFFGASAFNQAINNTGVGSWSAAMASVTSFLQMFINASAFNQSIGNWDISSASNMVDMVSGTAINTANYDDILIGWELPRLGATPSGIALGASGRTYTSAGAGGTARTALGADHGWSFVGDSGV